MYVLVLLLVPLAIGVWFGARLFLRQNRMIFRPGPVLDRSPATIGIRHEELQLAVADGTPVTAWWIDGHADAPAVVYFHGSEGNLTHELPVVQFLYSLGVNVLLAEYVGYGRDERRPNEAGCYRSADAAWRYVTHERAFPASRVVLFGHSLGASIAARSAAGRDCAGLVLQSGFTSVRDLAARAYPYLPVGPFLRTRMESVGPLRESRSPVLVIHSRDDEHISVRAGRAPLPRGGGTEEARHAARLTLRPGLAQVARDLQRVARAAGARLPDVGRVPGRRLMREEVRLIALEAKGFLAEAEGMRLYELARDGSRQAPCVEIGSYCGKSGLFLGEGCRETGRHPLFTIDHHRGSEEQQPGQDYFDAALYDVETDSATTLPELIRNIRLARLEDWVIPVVAGSNAVGRHWPDSTLSLVFIDGGHSEDDAMGDYRTWGRCVRPSGYLCVHDVSPDPSDGGQAPYHIVCAATSNGAWEHVDTVETLAVLRRR